MLTQELNIIADSDTDDLIFEYRYIQDNIKKLEKELDAVKTKILANIGDATKVEGQYGKIIRSYVPANPGKTITQEMVGTVINARAAYTTFKYSGV